VRWRRPAEGTAGLGGSRRAGAHGDSDDGVYIDYSDAQETPRFSRANGSVTCSSAGAVRELTGLGRELKAVIDFEAHGRKKVVLRYANLQKEL
jgi:hypothetical protein